MVVGHIDGPIDLRFPDLEDEAAEFVAAMQRLTFATQTVTFQMNETTAALVKLLTGWDFPTRNGPAPMPPGLVTWSARRRRHRRKR
jgi:hypothetical protein